MDDKLSSGGALPKDEIEDRLQTDDLSRKIFMVPIISKSQISDGSIDVRLGTEFILFKRCRYAILDPFVEPMETLESKLGKYQEMVYVPVGEKLVLHPQQLVLGCTLEYFRIPNDLICEVIGRSSWGRLGLIISAATLVHPGYAGVITLELANEGETPLTLYPGTRIAQLIFYKFVNIKAVKPILLRTKYMGATGPMFSKIHEDSDWKVLRNLK